MAMCAVAVLKNRALGLSVVWIVTMLSIYGLAVVGLEAFSPALYAPSNLTQLPITNLAAPLILVGGVSLCATFALLVAAPRLLRFQ